MKELKKILEGLLKQEPPCNKDDVAFWNGYDMALSDIIKMIDEMEED